MMCRFFNTAGALVDSSVSLLSIEGHLAPENGLKTVSSHELDSLVRHVLLHHLLHSCVLQCGSNIFLVHVSHDLALDHVLKLGLDGEENAANLSLGDLGGHLERSLLLLGDSGVICDGIINFLLLFLVEDLALAHLVLVDVLFHHLVVELKRVLVCQVVVDLSSNWLDAVQLVRASHVGDSVGVISGAMILVQDSFMGPSSVLLLHKSLGGRRVSLHVTTLVELTHHFVEAIHILACLTITLSCALSW